MEDLYLKSLGFKVQKPKEKNYEQRRKDFEACEKRNQQTMAKCKKLKMIATVLIGAYPFTVSLIHLVIHPLFCFANMAGDKLADHHICGWGFNFLMCSLDFAFSTAVILCVTYPIGIWVALCILCPIAYGLINLFTLETPSQYEETREEKQGEKLIATGIASIAAGRLFGKQKK